MVLVQSLSLRHGINEYGPVNCVKYEFMRNMLALLDGEEDVVRGEGGVGMRSATLNRQAAAFRPCAALGGMAFASRRLAEKSTPCACGLTLLGQTAHNSHLRRLARSSEHAKE
jgi:hypothetical protein